MSRHVRHTPIVLLAAASLGMGWNVYYRAVQSDRQRSDLLMLYAAGRAVLQGTDIYEARHPRGWPFYYPPAMAVALAPLALLPFTAAVIVWYGVNVAALLSASRRIVQLCDQIAGRPVGAWVVAAFVVNLGPIAVSLQRGQVTLVLFALMVEAFWSYRAGRSARCGAFIALAASLKVYPGLMVLPLLVRRDWRGLIGFTAALFVIGLLVPVLVMGPTTGPDAITRWAHSILIPFFAEARYADREVFAEFNQFAATNQSLFGVAARWLCGGALPDHEPFPLSLADSSTSVPRVLSVVASGALLAVTAAVALQKRARAGLGEAVVWALPMAAANFISHVGWHHYYVTSSLLYALAIIVIMQSGSGLRRRAVFAALAAAVLTNWLHMAILICRQMGFLMLGTMLLWGVLAAVTWRVGRWPPDTSDTSEFEW